jgi:uncharacterized protein
VKNQRSDADSKQMQAPAVAPTASRRPTNHLSGVADFLGRWDDTEGTMSTSDALFRVSPLGNINAEGSPSCESAAIFDRHHPLFLDSLEPGVRDLVVQLIERLGCITYSSCEGHRGLGSIQPFSLRQVGILPRDEREYQRLAEALVVLAGASNATGTAATVRIAVSSGVLTSEVEDRPCIDLVFVAVTDDEDAYFRDVEAASRTFLRALELYMGSISD